ncbi:GGDEF domain-containing phosphodiesterase [Octadecabacter sp. G9-8]|uniref:GGDEF domain-containing phosphodiesterase n=1 Tax=Octadecabacter dasysiphoniae TaxID=2909341 RepID=A0ABS9D0R6_9RHOB|nr:GGDEF domain-containing phosphodiesterase [Octadecabacter dasysiphoniae]MCF2872912.1 GGDEF domain-containing phosphodiesterase [Octadecabacter dasysiphoniae]
MRKLTGIPEQTAHRALAIVGFAASCIAAFVILGTTGLFAGMIFAPLLSVLALNTRDVPAEDVELSKQQKRPFIVGCLARFLGHIGHPTVAMIVEIDDFDRLEEVYGRQALEGALTFAQDSIETHLTADDVTVHLDGPRFVSALAPQGPHDLETMLNTCTRIQHSMANAPLVTELPVQLSASIGFAASNRIERPTAERLMEGAFSALAEARRKAPNAVRGFSKSISIKRASDIKIVKDAARAFERGEIFAYFQPQVRMGDGSLSGFEALTRWHHPERGIVSPADFLPALEQAGLMQQLGDTMIKQAIQALTFWDKSGLKVPRIGVNFSTHELRNPRLVDRIAMHLDVSNIAPERLVIEVLETVIASEGDDDIIGNLAALADLGCGIDLDDFGTGYASITNIKRFSVGRIKIDRSFVTGIDSDPEQQNMVTAILNMADRLGVRTLAEGIETRGERDALRRLGCEDAQGFYFARPMPIQETVDWAAAYFGTAQEPVRLTKRAG